MKLIATRRFDRELKRTVRLDPQKAARIEKTLWLLITNPHHPSLRLHKLAGSGIYSVSVDMSIRILLLWRADEIFLLRIGTHEDVY